MDMGKFCSCRARAQCGTKEFLIILSRLQQQGSSKGKSRAGKGRCCQLGFVWGSGGRDRKDLGRVKVTAAVGAAAREGLPVGVALGEAGQGTGHSRVCF